MKNSFTLDRSTFYCVDSGLSKLFWLLHNIVCKIPDHLDILQKSKLVHDGIVSRLGEQEVASTLGGLV